MDGIPLDRTRNPGPTGVFKADRWTVFRHSTHPMPTQADFKDDPGVALMLAWQGGDESAFDELVSLYSGRVYSLLTRFLGQHPSREDFVQEVFLRVVRARDRYEPNARFTTWLYRIVFNLSVNETQRASGRYQLSLDQPPGDEEQGRIEIEDTRDPDPTAAMQSGDVIHAVRRAIAALPENQRMAVVLAKFDDMPYVEIAKVLDSSEKAIKSLIHRARETLRAELAPFLEEDLL